MGLRSWFTIVLPSSFFRFLFNFFFLFPAFRSFFFVSLTHTSTHSLSLSIPLSLPLSLSLALYSSLFLSPSLSLSVSLSLSLLGLLKSLIDLLGHALLSENVHVLCYELLLQFDDRYQEKMIDNGIFVFSVY